MLKDDALLTAIEEEPLTAPLSAARLAMLRYAIKLTLKPASVSQEDVEALREVGFSDRDILEIAEIVAYYAYVNRIADGLGVEIEEPPTPD